MTPIRYYSPAERLRLIARYASHLMKVRLGSIGVIAEPNVEVSKADASVRDLKPVLVVKPVDPVGFRNKGSIPASFLQRIL